MPSLRRKLCREGAYYLLMLGAVFVWASIREANLLLLVAGVLTAPFFLNWWLAKSSLRGIAATRRLVHSATAGLPLHAEIEVRNQRRKLGSWGLSLEDRVVLEGTRKVDLRPRLFLLSLPAGQTRRPSYRLTLPRRGRYRLGPLQVTSRFPFGLFRYTLRVEDDQTLIVYPPQGLLSSLWRRRYDPLVQGAWGTRQAGRAPGDFFAVREWRTGDSSRWIHWRRSARQGELIVRQFEQPGDRRLVLLVDLWQPENPDQLDLDHVELVVSFAATVVADLCRRPGFQLRVGVTGDPPQWTSGPANVQLMAAALETLAVAEAGNRDLLPALMEGLDDEASQNMEVLVVSPRAERVLGDSQAMAAASARLSGRVRMLSPQDPKFREYFKAS